MGMMDSGLFFAKDQGMVKDHRETEAAAAVAAAEAPSGSAAGSVYDETHGGVFPKFCGERPGARFNRVLKTGPKIVPKSVPNSLTVQIPIF